MIPIRLDKEGAVTVALDVAQRGCRNNLLDVKELRRLVMLHQEKLSSCNLPGRAWNGAELLITPRLPEYNHDPVYNGPQMQTAVWLKYHLEDFTWYVHGIYRTKEALPKKRIKIKDFTAEQAKKALKGIIEHKTGIEVDGLSVFAIF